MRFNMKDIIIDGDPILRRKSVDIEVPLSNDDLELIQAMVDFVKRSQEPDAVDDDGKEFTSAIGMAAPQFGYHKRIFVYTEFYEGEPQYMVVVNPVITDSAKAKVQLTTGETCLSVPYGQPEKIYRSKNIRWDGYSVNPETGDYAKKRMSPVKGYFAIVFQHEYDHLEGIIYTDKIPGRLYMDDPEKDNLLNSYIPNAAYGKLG